MCRRFTSASYNVRKENKFENEIWREIFSTRLTRKRETDSSHTVETKRLQDWKIWRNYRLIYTSNLFAGCVLLVRTISFSPRIYRIKRTRRTDRSLGVLVYILVEPLPKLMYLSGLALQHSHTRTLVVVPRTRYTVFNYKYTSRIRITWNEAA